jgi:hypothetical protein
MSLIVEMRHGTTRHFNLDLHNDCDATSLLTRIEDTVQRIWVDVQRHIAVKDKLGCFNNNCAAVT